MFSGFLNLNKPIKESSNKALFAVKKVLRLRGIDAKVGHLGTLDPLACGVLPVALGRATRLFDYCLNKRKIYRAHFMFGVMSDSLDLGTEVRKTDDTVVTEEMIGAVLPFFLGKQNQFPPAYSAKSIGGVRAYKLARQGKEVDLRANEIEIYSILQCGRKEKNTYEFLIECSSGTYIRSIARDLGAAVGSSAVMSYLCREKSGEFELSNAVSEEELLASPDKLEEFVLPMETVLNGLPSYTIEPKENVMLNGIRIQAKIQGKQRLYSQDGTLIGIGETDENGQLFIKTRLI